MSKKGNNKSIEKLIDIVDESIEESKPEKKKEKQEKQNDTIDEKLLDAIDKDIKKEEDETRNRLVPLPNKVNQKISKKDSTEEPTEKFTEGLDTVADIKEIGGVEDDEENDIKSTTEVKPNKPIIVGKEDLPSCSCEEDSDHTETTSEPTNKPNEMTSKEAVAAMQSQVRRSWKGKVTFAVIMIVCISLAYYKPMYPDQDFFNNLTYYIIFIGMLAPLLLYIVVNEFDKYLKKKKGIDITKNHKDSLLVKQDKPKDAKSRPMSPLMASVLGTYYTMTEKMKDEESEENESVSARDSEEISGILSDMLSASESLHDDDDCKDGVCKKSGKMPEKLEEKTPEKMPDLKPEKKPEPIPTQTVVLKSEEKPEPEKMPESDTVAKTESKPEKNTEKKQDEQPEQE